MVIEIAFLLLDLRERLANRLSKLSAPVRLDLGGGKIDRIRPWGYGLDLIVTAKANEQELDALARGLILFQLLLKDAEAGIQFVDRRTLHRARTIKHDRARQSLARVIHERHIRNHTHFAPQWNAAKPKRRSQRRMPLSLAAPTNIV